MKKLKKSFKILLTVSISLVCTLAIVLGCVFGLKKEDKPTNNPSEEQGYEFTTSQKALLSLILALLLTVIPILFACSYGDAGAVAFMIIFTFFFVTIPLLLFSILTFFRK